MKIKSVWVIGALLLAAGVSRAYASTLVGATCENTSNAAASVLYSESCYVQGDAASVTMLQVPGAGNVSVTLTDLDFPTPFASLDFSLDSSSTTLVGLADPGTVWIGVDGPTTLYADVFATTQSGSGVGLYSLTASFLAGSPVPLPASGVLLAAALLLLLTPTYWRRLLRASRSCLSGALKAVASSGHNLNLM